MSAATSPGLNPRTAPWTRKHLLGLQDLSAEEILAILDTADSFSEISRRDRKKVPALQGRIVFNLFFENSTRTRHQFQPGGEATVRGHPGFLRHRLEPVQGRVVHRHGQEHRGHGRRRHGGPASDAGHAAPAGATREVLDHQCGRRRPRTPHPGLAGLDDDPTRQGSDRRPDRRAGRRHLPLASGPFQHLCPDQAGRQGHPVRAADARVQGLGTAWLRSGLPSRGCLAALRRRERVADPVRAAEARIVPVRGRVFSVLHDESGARCASPSQTCCSSRPARSIAVSS